MHSDNQRHTFESREVFKFEKGLVVFKKFIDRGTQIEIVQQMLTENVDPKKSFWKTDSVGNKVLNVNEYRGRRFGAFQDFPRKLQELYQQALARASQVDDSLHFVNATHLISLYYKTLAEPPSGGFIPWHQDNGENDGEGDYSVVSLSLGDSCDFLIAHEKPKVSHDHPFHRTWLIESYSNQETRLFLEDHVAIFGTQFIKYIPIQLPLFYLFKTVG